MKNKNSCLIIGLGKIGMGDKTRMINNNQLTHVNTIKKHEKFELIGAIETNIKKRSIFEKEQNKPSYKEIKDLPNNTTIDLVIISSPTNSHLEITKKLLKYIKPKIILFEKPFGNSLKGAKKISAICEKKKVKIFINYPRHTLPESLIVKNHIKNKDIKGKVIITNGVQNTGSHFIELMSFLFGKIVSIKRTSQIERLKNDFACNFTLMYKKAIIEFYHKRSIKKGNYSISLSNLDIDLLWTQFIEKYNKKNKLKMIIKINNKKNRIKKLINVKLQKYQFYVYNEIHKYIAGKKNEICDHNNGIAVQEILNSLKKS